MSDIPKKHEGFEGMKNLSEIEGLSQEQQEKVIKEYLQTLELIAQRVGGDFDMKVKVGMPGEGSYFNPDNTSITFDPLHLIEDFDEAKFVAGHEGAHRAITPNPKEIGLSKEETHRLYSQLGFPYMHNMIEDGAINSWMMERFPGLEEYTKKTYDGQFQEENAVLSTPEVNQFAKRLGYMPKFSHLMSEILRDWHGKDFSKNLDPAVEKALKRTIEYARKSIKTTPDPTKMDRREIIKTGKKRFDINNDYVWPEVKKLVDMDLETEAQRQMLNDAHEKQKELEEKKKEFQEAEKNNDEAKQKELKKEIDDLEKELDPFENLPEDVKKELEEKIEEALRELEGLDNEPIDNEPIDIDKEEDMPPDSVETPEEKEGEVEKTDELEGEKQDQPEESGEEVEGKDKKEIKDRPFPKDKLSEKAQKLIEKIFKKLLAKKRQELLEKARKQLEDLEDLMNKEIQGRLNKNPESHAEQEEREAEEVRQSEYEKQQEEDKERIAKELEKERRKLMSSYELARSEVVGSIDDLYLHLRRIFKPEDYGGKESGYQSGQELDIVRAMQADHDPEQKSKMFIRETSPEKKSYRFWHLLDVSGSMVGEKQQETEKGFIIVGEALDRIEDLNSNTTDIKQGITAFHNRIFPYKEMEERFTRKTEDNLSSMAERVQDYDSGTNTYEATVFALEQLQQDLGETGNFLLTFSDGQPNWNVIEQLKQTLKEGKDERRKQKIKVGLIWLGELENQQLVEDMVKEFGYDFGLVMSAVKPSDQERTAGKKDFSTALAELMEDLVENPEKY